MPRCDDAAITQDKNRIDWIDDFGIGDRVDLVHSDDLAISSQAHFVSAANDIQVADANVIFDRNLLNARDDVKVTDAYVVVDRALAGVDDADTNADAFADSITKKPTIEGAF